MTKLTPLFLLVYFGCTNSHLRKQPEIDIVTNGNTVTTYDGGDCVALDITPWVVSLGEASNNIDGCGAAKGILLFGPGWGLLPAFPHRVDMLAIANWATVDLTTLCQEKSDIGVVVLVGDTEVVFNESVVENPHGLKPCDTFTISVSRDVIPSYLHWRSLTEPTK